VRESGANAVSAWAAKKSKGPGFRELRTGVNAVSGKTGPCREAKAIRGRDGRGRE